MKKFAIYALTVAIGIGCVAECNACFLGRLVKGAAKVVRGCR